VWGNAAETLPIEVNQQEFNVMTNLYSALHHIRLEDGERVLWINAISINQNDMGEQNRQVHLMAEIYACTQGVITWFGQQMDHSDRALELLQNLEGTGHLAESPLWHNPATGALLSDSELAEIFDPLWKLSGNLWFTRIWAVQE